MRFLPFSLALASVLAAPAAMAAVVFDFEGETTGLQGSSLAITVSGITMTISRLSGADVEIRNISSISANSPPSWGSRTLSPFNSMSGGGFLLTFSSAIAAISVEAGDFAPSDADRMSLTVGGSADSDSLTASQGLPSFVTLSLSGLNNTQAILSGGSATFPQSVFWDNISIELANQVPVPTTLALASAGLLLLRGRRRQA